MIAVWGCVLALLLDLFDRFERRYALDRMRGQRPPKRWLAWGLFDPGQTTHWLRYFQLRLSSYSWEYDWSRDDWSFAQRVLIWVEGRGWQIWFDHG